ncbi:dihydroxyacetone kinase subunit DhaL [Trichococcus shcherbakoviae]|uniref:phosphoenolpyruvate--glycerone phosphotransferase n=1 Tax=Trichococcus shcherbakoviae subsp. psychrophilus TaxID=2585775 RepID=A0A5C5E5R4_9LACT|nr:dihydroxyacetone kinase subunit DhaL [Trichococcus shcherbakoviae]TNV67960.1 dihydroxyacetone kinase subunit L [Trichococcus shcherbakoviae subsp. psychrophilus]TNV69533.1 dihydroxyacetone kinase subunit L [Trichococcus shcherbakoviae subsp. psychrophilus]
MLTVETVRSWLSLFIEKLEKNEKYLNTLDEPIGDGDHGANMLRGAKDLRGKLAEGLQAGLSELFKMAGMSFIQKTGGAAGLLYGQVFLHMSEAFQEDTNLLDSLASGLEGIQTFGPTELKEKTLVDVWIPVMEDIRNKRLTLDRINEHVISTKDFQAKKGRAAFVSKQLNGHIDPGAASCGYFFEAMLEAGVYDE